MLKSNSRTFTTSAVTSVEALTREIQWGGLHRCKENRQLGFRELGVKGLG